MKDALKNSLLYKRSNYSFSWNKEAAPFHCVHKRQSSEWGWHTTKEHRFPYSWGHFLIEFTDISANSKMYFVFGSALLQVYNVSVLM